MKSGRLHRVPLTDRAIAILSEVERLRSSDFVFPGQRADRPLSGMAFEMVLRRMKVVDAIPHGFRSSSRDRDGESTSLPREVAEASLAHVVGDEVERAYRRGDALAKRRELMTAWAAFVTGEQPIVIRLSTRSPARNVDAAQKSG
ncbi:tyrosine-type recombinase/integrase [uncultured Enterovirga sp.]|uniref:tyrosine-type recombinase/integrase n=1 Tax=uncultured Enterovirga sp. TaxID=2026352 RepID=UPI0035CB4CB2